MCVVLTQLKIIKIAQLKINNLRVIVVCAGLHVYNRLLHGFWSKEATIVEGWIDDTILFWESYI